MGAKQLIRNTFHASTVVMFLAAIVQFEMLPPMPHQKEHEHFGGRLKYLTYWNVWMQFLYFAFSLYIDHGKPSPRNYTKLIRLRDRFFTSIILPYGLFVFAVFWILYSINRELIFPRALDGIFPVWLNHVSHTAIVLSLLVESFLIKHRHPKKKDGLRVALMFGLVYVIWILYLGLVMDIWVYPVFKVLNWGMRGVFIGSCAVSVLLMYWIGERITGLMWG